MKEQVKVILFTFSLFLLLLSGCAHNGARNHAQSPDPGDVFSAFQDKNIFTSDPKLSDPQEKNDLMNDFEEEYSEETVRIADPLSPWNRAMFHFNDKLYFWILKPLARGYKIVMPRLVRAGVRNFFHNIVTPVRLASCLLQGKGEAAGAEIGRFLVNSTVGVLGFGNPAKKDPRLNPGEEDIGQALAVYKIGNGPYLVWPFLGPSTLRDSVGLLGDAFLTPVNYVRPIATSVGITAYETINETSFRIGDYESFKKAAIEPYEALRDVYLQNRQKKINE